MNDFSMNELNNLFVPNETLELINAPLGSLSQLIFQSKNASVESAGRSMINEMLAASPALAEAYKSLGKDEKLRLVFSEETKRKLAEGSYRLMKVKDNSSMFRAIAVDADGKTREIGKIAIDGIPKSIDPISMAMAMQGIAIQQQLQDISEQLEQISAEMRDVLMGQHNDRLALYYAGEMQLKESIAVSDAQLKRQLTCSAMNALSEGCSSLQVTVIYDIKSLLDKYDEDKRRIKMKTQEIDEKMYVIKSSFETIHQCVYLKAAIYYNLNEYNALAVLLNSYKAFLEQTLDSRAENLLYNYDRSEKKLSGIWKNRAIVFPRQIDELSAKVTSHEAYLEIGRCE